MKLYALSLGRYAVDARILDASASGRTSVPVWALLIRHEQGNLLFDLGCAAEDPALTAGPGETLEAQLARLGMTAGDVGTAVISHFHGDHFGALPLLTHADVYVPAEDWTAALTYACERAERRRGALWERLMLPVKAYHPVRAGGDFELMRGVRVLTLPGHTANLLGLDVTVGGRRFIFPSDSVYSPVNFERLPGACLDAQTYERSRERLRALEREGGEIVYSHWTAQFERLPKAPHPLTED